MGKGRKSVSSALCDMLTDGSHTAAAEAHAIAVNHGGTFNTHAYTVDTSGRDSGGVGRVQGQNTKF